MSFSMASRTAPREPGITKTTRPCARPRERTRKQRRRADVFVRELTKDLAKAGDRAFEQWLDGIGRDVAGRDSGAAGQDHGTHAFGRESCASGSADRGGFIGHDLPPVHLVPFAFEHLGNEEPTGIGFEGAGIAHRNHGDRHAHGRFLAVMMGVRRRLLSVIVLVVVSVLVFVTVFVIVIAHA